MYANEKGTLHRTGKRITPSQDPLEICYVEELSRCCDHSSHAGWVGSVQAVLPGPVRIGATVMIYCCVSSSGNSCRSKRAMSKPSGLTFPSF